MLHSKTFRENRHSISMGHPSMGGPCQYIFPRRLYLSLAKDWCKHVESMVADERRQFENRAAICRGNPKIPRMAFCLSGDQVGDTSRGHRLPRLCFYLFVSAMTRPESLGKPNYRPASFFAPLPAPSSRPNTARTNRIIDLL